MTTLGMLLFALISGAGFWTGVRVNASVEEYLYLSIGTAILVFTGLIMWIWWDYYLYLLKLALMVDWL